MKALILAGGLGSRLNEYTNGQYPKLLLSLGNQTMLDKLIHFWFEDQGVSEMLIVLSEENYLSKIQKYINTFHSNRKIRLAIYPKTDGTFRTVFYILNKFPEYCKDTYLTWSDIFPKQPLVSSSTNSTLTVFTDSNKVHRYNLEDQKISYTPSHNGNIMGLYYMRDFDPIFMINFFETVSTDDHEIDLVDYLMDCTERNSISIHQESDTDVYDIGDVPKYERYLETQSVDQRWFNNIQFKNGKVYKQAVNSQGVSVMQNESGFYHFIKEKNLDSSFPGIYLANSKEIVMDDMTRQGYQTVHEYLSNKDHNYIYEHDIEPILTAYKSAIADLNGEYEYQKFNADVFREYYQVPIERYNKIEYLIPKNIDTVNGVKIPQFYDLMEKLLIYLKNKEYSIGVIHGDTNSSNTMFNGDNICFIDPRGKFGHSLYYGDINYDHAKFMYGLTGYDQFNLDKNFKIKIHNNQINFNIDGLDLDRICTNIHHKILVGLIWLKLPFYIKNNPNKVIASYFYGMQLLTKYLL